MRSLIQLTINPADTTEAKNIVKRFLETHKFIPTSLDISDELYDGIMEVDEIQRDEKNLEPLFQQVALGDLTVNSGARAAADTDMAGKKNAFNDRKNAIRVLSSIPKEPNDERSNAVANAAFSISCPVKRPSSALVPGVVSIRDSRVEIRFRHTNARILEEATTQFVRDVWKEMGETSTFMAFQDGETVAIREPFSSEDIYQGTIRTPRDVGSRLRETVRSHVSEFVVFLISVFFSAILFFLSLSILRQIEASPKGVVAGVQGLQWRQGWFDRLATGAFTTAVYSFVDLAAYFFRVYKLPVIDWR